MRRHTKTRGRFLHRTERVDKYQEKNASFVSHREILNITVIPQRLSKRCFDVVWGANWRNNRARAKLQVVMVIDQFIGTKYPHAAPGRIITTAIRFFICKSLSYRIRLLQNFAIHTKTRGRFLCRAGAGSLVGTYTPHDPHGYVGYCNKCNAVK